jgi:23S rRNA (guanosine2251-2'-O)-methyltransferase
LRTARPDRPGARPRPPSGPRDTRASGDLIFGRNAVTAALKGRRQHRRLSIAEGVREDQRVREIIALAKAKKIPVDRMPAEELDRRTRFSNHQGVVLESSGYVYQTLEEITDASSTTIVALDHLQDPQNVGTLIRAALAFGTGGMLLPKNRAASITAAVVNSSAGATEQLPIALISNLHSTLERLKKQGWWIVGLDQGARTQPLPLTAIPTPAVVVIGSEGSGLSDLIRQTCDLVVSIPMSEAAESLNAATAGAIALYEISRQQLSDPNAGR